MINKLPEALAEFHSTVGGNEFVSGVINMYSRNNERETPSADELTNINVMEGFSGFNLDMARPSDLRFAKVMMHGVRGIPVKSIKDFCGFDLTDSQGKPVSAVFLGTNGAGKTSFYCGMEMVSTGKSNVAKLRGYETWDQQKEFITNVDNSLEDVDITVKTASGEIYSWNRLEEGNNLLGEGSFCSDFDIEKLEKTGSRSGREFYDSYINDQLGLSGMKELIDTLETYVNMLNSPKHAEQTAKFSGVRKSLIDFEAASLGLRLQDNAMPEEERRLRELFADDGWFDALKTDPESGPDRERLASLLENDRALSAARVSLLNEWKCVAKVLLDPLHTGKYLSDAEAKVYYGNPLGAFRAEEFLVSSEIYSTCVMCLLNAWEADIDNRRNIHASKIKYWMLLSELRQRFKAVAEECGDGVGADKRDVYLSAMQTAKDKIGAEHFTWFETYNRQLTPFEIKEGVTGAMTLREFLMKKLLVYKLNALRTINMVFPQIMDRRFLEDRDRVEISIEGIPESTDEEALARMARMPQFRIPNFNIHIVRKPGDGSDDISQTKRLEPRLYFNTFRHKLFCFTLKLAILCCEMELNGYAMPVVVDDVFNSSDFNNRRDICSCVESLTRGYNEIAARHGADSSDIAIQLIFFTQDEVIGENVYKGLVRGGNKAILARLMPIGIYHEADAVPLDENYDICGWYYPESPTVKALINDTHLGPVFRPVYDIIKTTR